VNEIDVKPPQCDLQPVCGPASQTQPVNPDGAVRKTTPFDVDGEAQPMPSPAEHRGCDDQLEHRMRHENSQLLAFFALFGWRICRIVCRLKVTDKGQAVPPPRVGRVDRPELLQS